VIVREILQRSATWLAGKGFESARLEAELLLAHVLGTERLGLYACADEALNEDTLEAYRALLRRRVAGEPVAYLTRCSTSAPAAAASPWPARSGSRRRKSQPRT
jgi:methylase of polypeptide subunit release factors